MKQHIFKIAAAIVTAVLVLSSCDSRQEFIKYSTTLNFSVSDRGAASAVITVRPDEDKVYYYYAVVDKERYDSKQFSPMQYLDSCIRADKEIYDIKDTLLWDSPYNCSFADYALKYATTTVKFSGLAVAAEYVAMGICVDPDTNSPLGEVQTFNFSTLDIHEIKESEMKFDFMVVTKDSTEVRLYMKPQYETKTGICKDLYMSYGAMSRKELDEEFGGDVRNCVLWLIGDEMAPLLDMSLYNDISEIFYDLDITLETFVEGEEYIVWACPYSLDWYDHIYTLTFTYHEDMKIEYTHDPK